MGRRSGDCDTFSSCAVLYCDLNHLAFIDVKNVVTK